MASAVKQNVFNLRHVCERTLEPKETRGGTNTMQRPFLTKKGMGHRGVRNPNFWLEGSLGNRNKTDQKQVFNFHDSLTDLPPIFNRCIQR